MSLTFPTKVRLVDELVAHYQHIAKEHGVNSIQADLFIEKYKDITWVDIHSRQRWYFEDAIRALLPLLLGFRVDNIQEQKPPGALNCLDGSEPFEDTRDPAEDTRDPADWWRQSNTSDDSWLSEPVEGSEDPADWWKHG